MSTRPAAAAAPPGADMPRFLRGLMDFVALDEADVAAIRASAPLVLAREAELTTALYDHLLAFPDTARFFLADDGTPDRERLERRKHTLARWLRATAEVATTQEFSYYALAVGLSHSHHRAERGGPVPPHFMVGALSLLQTALARLFEDGPGGPGAALAASMAWNKLLMVQLAVLLLGYPPPSPR